ncbi:recombinase family protein (plasmid) [Deinococcus sp. D7000]|nr:recombinase family protein [Deinococcus sp. D7000]QLG13560.1 recombinase family protein [Deinococcus sp. D7000]
MTPRPAIGCTRLSTGPQARMYGQEVQAQEITRYAEAQGYDLLEIVPEVISGKTDPENRATVQRYLRLAEERPGLTFIFPRVDRVGRGAERILKIVRELHERHADVQVIGIPGDLRTKEGMLLLTMLAGVAEYDHTNLRGNMQAGMRQKAQAGLWPHGSPPWGYAMERDDRGKALRPVPVPEQAAAVRRLYELAIDHGETVTLQTMQAEGWPAPTEAGWKRRTVHNLLNNSLYSGVRVYQGITVTYEPIVPPELVARVQQLRQARRSGGRIPREPLLFSGHLRCVCGAAMGRDVDMSSYKGKRYATYETYRCWRKKNQRLDNPSVEQMHAPTLQARALEPLLWEALVEHLTSSELLAGIVAPQGAPPSGPDPLRVAELEAAIARAYEPLTAGAVGYTLAIAESLAQPYAQELERLRRQARAQAAPPPPDFEAQATAFRGALSKPLELGERRELLDVLAVQIVIGAEGWQEIRVQLP